MPGAVSSAADAHPSDAATSDAPACIALLIVSSVRLYRDGLKNLFATTDGFDVVATACDAAEARRLVVDLHPDAALLDLPAAAAAVLTRRLLRASSHVKVIAIGVGELEDELMPLIEAGLAAYVTREESIDDLMLAIRRAVRNESMCSPRMVGVLLRRIVTLAGERNDDEGPSLTTRELEVVALIDDGLSNKEIAQRLYIEVPTVKNHVHNILDKLAVESRAEAATKMRWRLHRPV